MIKNFIDNAIKQMDARGDKYRPHYDSWVKFLLDHRTIRLELPRQFGKTTTLLQLFRQHESILVMHNYSMVRHLVGTGRLSDEELPDVITPWSQDSNLVVMLASRIKSEGRSLRCVLVDEPSMIKCDILQLINALCKCNCLADDFFLVEVGTSVR